MLQLTFHFSSLAFVLTLFFILGTWVRTRIQENNESIFAALFINTLLGLFLFTAGVALYFTQFKSIFSLLLLALLSLMLAATKSGSTTYIFSNPLHLKKYCTLMLLPFAFILLFLFFWFGRLVFDSNFALGIPANPETILYAQFSKIISASGVESILGVGFLPHSFPNFPSPYHYFDLWFTSGISHIFYLSELETIHYFTLPLFNFINVLGLCAVFEKLTSPKFYHPFLALLFLFISGCYFFPFAERFSNFQFNYLEPMMSLYGEKLSFAFALILLIFLHILKNEKRIAFYFLILIPLLFPTLLLPIYSSLPVFYFLAFHKNLISWNEIKGPVIFQLCIMTSSYLFYTHWGNTSFSLMQISDFKGFNITSFKMIVAEIFYRAWDKPLKSLLLYSPYILLYFISRKSEKLSTTFKIIFLLASCIYAVALFSWALVYKLPESTQIYTNAFIFLHATLCLILFNSIFVSKDVKQPILTKFIFIALLLTSVLFSFKSYSDSKKSYNYSTSFLSKISSISFSAKEMFVAAYLKNPQEYRAPLEYLTGGLTGSYLQLNKQFYGMVNIGIYELLDAKKFAPELKQKFATQNFYTFVEAQKQQNKFISIPQSQLDFLSFYHITYLAASAKAVIPVEIVKRTKNIFIDSFSGERFLILDNSATFK